MQASLIRDAHAHPDLFDLRLPASPEEVASVEERLSLRLPPSFTEVLEALGQGSFFDNETLLGVHETAEGIGDIVQINHEMRDKQGLPDTLLVFHFGPHALHAFDTETLGPEYEVVELDEDTLERGNIYADFTSWYLAGLRPEYASLLGLE